MATLYATNPLTGVAWSDDSPVVKPAAGSAGLASGYYELATAPAGNDVIRFCKLPKGAVAVAGWFTGDDVETHATTPTLDIDIGWEANGVDSVDTDGFGNMGLLNGAAVTNVIPVASIWRPLQGVLNTEGVKAFAAETWVSGLVNVTAAEGGTGTISVKVLYVVP